MQVFSFEFQCERKKSSQMGMGIIGTRNARRVETLFPHDHCE